VSFVKLADIGLHRNGHMMMMEKNSDAIAQVIVDWLDKMCRRGGNLPKNRIASLLGVSARYQRLSA
jgi:hypothetical protein